MGTDGHVVLLLSCDSLSDIVEINLRRSSLTVSKWLSGVPDYFGRNKISSGGDLSHYSSASLY